MSNQGNKKRTLEAKEKKIQTTMVKTNSDASAISLNAHELNCTIKTQIFSEWILKF